ncbi:MAG: transposase [Spirochaetia bacterium]|jgi:putative transposase|nr:transposase [Spirochaetia bacterium]
MPRKPRLDIPGYYHIINRGVEKRIIFMVDSDFQEFMRILNTSSQVYHFKLQAYALMSNHYHLLIETQSDNLSLIMRQINSKYSIYFNKKYNRVGPLWQGRFKAFYIPGENYLNIVVKYIENNPLKAGIVPEGESYSYVSKNNYLSSSLEWKNLEIEVHKNDFVTVKEKKSLPLYFEEEKIKDSQIVSAYMDGHRQSSIADFLKISVALVSRRIKNYSEKRGLFLKIKEKGIFWSYDKKIEYSPALDDLFIESVLKYGDFDDLKILFSLYGKRVITKVWKEKLFCDVRFIKLNYFIARIFLGLNIEADYFTGAMNEREKRLRFLAS